MITALEGQAVEELSKLKSLDLAIDGTSAQQQKDIQPYEPGEPAPKRAPRGDWAETFGHWNPYLAIRRLLLNLLDSGVLIA